MTISIQEIKKDAAKSAGLAGAFAGGLISIYSFFQYSAIDPLGYIFLPILALAMAGALGSVLYCAIYILQCIFIQHQYRSGKLVLALILFWPACQVTLTMWQLISPATEKIIQDTLHMNSEQLDAAADQVINHPDFWYRDRELKLGRILMNPHTTATTLARIADIDDPRFEQALGAIFRIYFATDENTSIMTLIVHHPNVTPGILAKIYSKASPELKNAIEEKLKQEK